MLRSFPAWGRDVLQPARPLLGAVFGGGRGLSRDEEEVPASESLRGVVLDRTHDAWHQHLFVYVRTRIPWVDRHCSSFGNCPFVERPRLFLSSLEALG